MSVRGRRVREGDSIPSRRAGDSLAVEPTDHDDAAVQLWAHVGGEEQRGVLLDFPATVALIEALVARLPVLAANGPTYPLALPSSDSSAPISDR